MDGPCAETIFRPTRKRARLSTSVVGVLLLLQASMLAWIGARNAPALDEVAHLPAGLLHLQCCAFDLYNVNPPLVRMIAASPLLLCAPKTDWVLAPLDDYARPEFAVGAAFCRQNTPAFFWYFTLGRWACLPLVLAGSWLVYRWATDLYGAVSGLTALVLWCFSPAILANGALLTPDAAAAATGLAAGYFYWRWLRRPSWGRAAAAGTAMGLALLSKGTWIILIPLWPMLWIIWRLSRRPRFRPAEADERGRPQGISRPPATQLALLVVLAVYLLNLGYCFERSLTSLNRFSFISQLFGGADAHHDPGNRFSQSWLGRIPVPLPFNYVRGIDVQRHEFEVGKSSYLRGEQKFRGWWYWYLYAVAVKEPIALLVLLALATVAARRGNRSRQGQLDALALLLPSLVLFTVVSSQTGFSRYERYVIPAFPFLFIWASRVVAAPAVGRQTSRVATGVLVCWLVASSLSIYPHSLSYFNELAGGPYGGPRHLLDANVDWGQDLLYFKHWSDAHPECHPLFLDYFGFTNPAAAGIDCPGIPVAGVDSSGRRTRCPRRLCPGWYAVSVNDLFGYRYFEVDAGYSYLRPIGRVAAAGYSIYILHLTADGIRGLGAAPDQAASDQERPWGHPIAQQNAMAGSN